MSTSEPEKKPAKKTAKKVTAAKKASKKPAKKVAVKATVKERKAATEIADTILTAPDPTAVLEELGDVLGEIDAEAEALGVPVIHGTATVSLHMEFENATTPVDAVSQAIHELAINGLRGYTFIVRDEATGKVYAVSDGQVLNLDV